MNKDMSTIKLIVPLSKLKDGSVCYKPSGEKRYIVRRKIFIGDSTINADKSSVFLVAETGGSNYITAHLDATEVRYHCENISDVYELYGEEDDCK